MIELRELTVGDWPAWRELRLAALAEAPYAFGSTLADWQGDGDRAERWRGRLGIPGSYNLLAVLDGRPVGMVSGVPTGTAEVAELVSMWVAPEARGRGVGNRLIEAVAGWARRRGARVLRLSVVPDNTAAVALYERNGFRYGGKVGDLMPDGVRREKIMEMALAADGDEPARAGVSAAG